MNKTSLSRSVVFPPIYDTAALLMPVLQPGQPLTQRRLTHIEPFGRRSKGSDLGQGVEQLEVPEFHVHNVRLSNGAKSLW